MIDVATRKTPNHHSLMRVSFAHQNDLSQSSPWISSDFFGTRLHSSAQRFIGPQRMKDGTKSVWQLLGECKICLLIANPNVLGLFGRTEFDGREKAPRLVSRRTAPSHPSRAKNLTVGNADLIMRCRIGTGFQRGGTKYVNVTI